MAEANGKNKRLIAERTRALAIMYLTRRSDLAVEEPGNDLGLDLIVRMLHEEKPGLRQFGVELRGTLAAITKEHADKVLRPSIQQSRRAGPFPFPVCLFYFTMKDDQGWFTWVAEPVVAPDDTLHLLHHETANCQRLNQESIDLIVEEVDHWYDAFFDQLVEEEPKGRTAKR